MCSNTPIRRKYNPALATLAGTTVVDLAPWFLYLSTDNLIFVFHVQEPLFPALSASKTVQIIVEAINDGPSITGPLEMVAEEDTPTAMNGITVHDPDCDDVPRGVLEVAITASNGTMQLLGSVAGLYLMEALPGSLKIRGKTGSVNVALAGLSYVAATDFSGRDTILVTADDLGNSGTGGALSATWSTQVVVTAVNDPPVILPPAELDLAAGGVLFVLEDETSPLGAFGVSDVDDVFLRVSVSAQVGSVRTNGMDKESMLVVTSSDEAYAATGSRITFEGTSDEVSAALGNLRYTSSLNWNSVASESRDVVEVSRVCENLRPYFSAGRCFVLSSKSSQDANRGMVSQKRTVIRQLIL